MSDFKKYGVEENKLKKADAKKAESVEPAGAASELSFSRKKRGTFSMVPLSTKKKKRFPIVVDIIVAVVMLAVLGVVLVGAYALLKNYSNDYKGVSVEYTVVCEGKDLNSLVSLTNENIYCDIDGNALYFGRVKEVRIEKNAELQKVIFTLERDGVKYRDGEGYSISDERLAVGATYCLRYEKTSFECTVVELSRAEKGGK